MHYSHPYKAKTAQGPFPACADMEGSMACEGNGKGLNILLCRILVDGTLGNKTKDQTASYPSLWYLDSSYR